MAKYWSHRIGPYGASLYLYERVDGGRRRIYALWRRQGRRHRIALGHGDRQKAVAWAASMQHAIEEGKAHAGLPSRAVLYVIQRGGVDGPVKIGISTNLRERMKAMRTLIPDGLTVLGVFSLRDVERALHKHCEQARIDGEWYDASVAGTVLDLLEVAPPSSRSFTPGEATTSAHDAKTRGPNGL